MSKPTAGLNAAARRCLLPERFRLQYALVAANTHEAITIMRVPLPDPGDPNERALALLKVADERATAATSAARDAVEQLRSNEFVMAVNVSVARFLVDSLIPSIQVLHSGIALELGTFRIESEELQTLRRQFNAIAQRPDLNYRVRYNIACYRASEAAYDDDVSRAESRRADALTSLERALASAPLPVVDGLVQWAAKDPSLSALRTSRWRVRFDSVLRRFAAPGALEPPNSLAELDSVGPFGAELLRRLGIYEPDDMPYDQNSIAGEWLAETLGVPYSWAKRWADAIGLAALSPLTPADVNALSGVNVRTVQTLAGLDPVQLHAAFESLETKPPGWSVPKLEVLDHWIMAARRRI